MSGFSDLHNEMREHEQRVTPEPVKTLVERLEDLHTQATRERSHFYVGSLCREAAAALAELAERVKAAERERDKAYETAQNFNAQQFNANARVTELKAQRDELVGALAKAPFPNGYDPDYTFWWGNGREDALAKHRDPYGPIGHETC